MIGKAFTKERQRKKYTLTKCGFEEAMCLFPLSQCKTSEVHYFLQEERQLYLNIYNYKYLSHWKTHWKYAYNV